MSAATSEVSNVHSHRAAPIDPSARRIGLTLHAATRERDEHAGPAPSSAAVEPERQEPTPARAHRPAAPPPLTPALIGVLQRTAGNAAVTALVRRAAAPARPRRSGFNAPPPADGAKAHGAGGATAGTQPAAPADAHAADPSSHEAARGQVRAQLAQAQPAALGSHRHAGPPTTGSKAPAAQAGPKSKASSAAGGKPKLPSSASQETGEPPERPPLEAPKHKTTNNALDVDQRPDRPKDEPPVPVPDAEAEPDEGVGVAEPQAGAAAAPPATPSGAPRPQGPAGPIARRGVQRQPQHGQQERPAMIFPAETLIVGRPNVRLFDMVTPISKRWDAQPLFRPLASGTFIVDGIPITYHLEGSARAGTYAGLSFGPGTLEQIRVFVTGAEADRLRAIDHPPIYDPILGPIGVLPDILNRAWDRDPNGSFEGDAMLRFSAFASAGANANAHLSGDLGIFGGALAAGAEAGLTGSATADARTNVNTYVSLRWNNGTITMTAALDLYAALDLAFRVSAYAGVWVELRVPEIPVVTDLTHAVQDWPIIGWVTPDLSRWRWRKDYRKEWPLLDKRYRWEMTQRFVVNGPSATGALPDADGFDIENVLREAEAKQKEGDLKDDDEGPGRERRNSDPAAISAAKSSALAQISSAKRAAEREKRANARLLTQARRAAAASGGGGGGSSGPPAAASVTGSGGTPVDQLETRGENLDKAVKSTDQLREKTDALNQPASAPDGASRNEARSGYESIAANADALGDKIDRGEEGFAVPAGVEPTDADYERMRQAMHSAYAAFDDAFDPTRTEKLYADDQVRESGTDADLAAYRNAAENYQHRAGELWRRVQKLEEDLEKAREWYERHDHALGAVVFGELETKARAIATDAAALKLTRPVGDWDNDFVELSGGHLVLKPQYRGRATRSYFYPHDYSAGTKDRLIREIGSFRTGDDGKVYWEFRGRRSPRGDFWWLLVDDEEMPTLDHTRPTVLGHWNSIGSKKAYNDRRRFYDFEGAPITVVPKTMNSSAGGREPDSYTPHVTRDFRGAKT